MRRFVFTAFLFVPLTAIGADLSWVRPALTDPDPASRQAALKRLAAVATDASDMGDDVAARLRDDDPDTRYWAADALLAMQPCTPGVLQALGVAAADASSSVRARALDALAPCGSKASLQLPAIMKAIDDDQATVVHSAVATAGELGPSALTALPQLLKAARSSDPYTRYYAVYSIGQVLGNAGEETSVPGNQPKVVAALVAASNDQDDDVRSAAAHGLLAAMPSLSHDVQVRDALLRLSADHDEDVRRNAADALTSLARHNSDENGSPAAAEMAWGRLSEMLRDGTQRVRLGAVEGLTGESVSEDAVPALAAALSDGSPAIRTKAAGALAKLPDAVDPETLTALTAAAGDSVVEVKLAAINAIGKIGAAYPLAETTPSVVAAAGSDDTRVRTAAAETLGLLFAAWAKTANSGTDGSVPNGALDAVYRLTRDTTKEIRLAALQSIHSAAPLLVPRFDGLVATLADSDAGVRAEALETIGAYGATAVSVVPDLIRMTHDSESSVRSAAAMDLGYVTHTDPAALKALMAALDDSSSDVRTAAAKGIGWYGKLAEAAIPALVAGSRNPKNSAADFGAALGLIGEQGTEAVKQALAATPVPPAQPKPRSLKEAFTRPLTEYEQLTRAVKTAGAHSRTAHFDAVDAAGRPVALTVSAREPLVLVATWCHFSDDWRRTVTDSVLRPFLKDVRIHLIFENSEWGTIEQHAREEAAEKHMTPEEVAQWLSNRKTESGDARLFNPNFLHPEPGDHYFLAKEMTDGSFPTYFSPQDGKFISSPDDWLHTLPIPSDVLKLAKARAGAARDGE